MAREKLVNRLSAYNEPRLKKVKLYIKALVPEDAVMLDIKIALPVDEITEKPYSPLWDELGSDDFLDGISLN